MPDVFTSKKESKKPKENKVNLEEILLKAPEGEEKHNLPGHSHNPLSPYSLYPDEVNFVNKDSEEKVILLLRKHPITNIGWISIAFILIIAPSFLSLFSFFEALPDRFQIVTILIWYLMTTSFILEGFLRWFFHVNIITDERIIEVDFANLFYREITDANIDQIQDVTVMVGGARRTFFDYGDVLIQTAAEIPMIQFEAVPKPDLVAKILRELRIQEEVEKTEGRVR